MSFLLRTGFCAAGLAAIMSPTLYAGTYSFGSGDNQFTMEFVSIGSRERRPTENVYVPYNYNMGKFEVSEEIFNKASVAGNLGISTQRTDGPNKPAVVAWHDAAKFTNWLNTSSGHPPAYKIIDDQPHLWNKGEAGYNPDNRMRNSLAVYVLPTTAEWSKSAFYDPKLDYYYEYATGSDSWPTAVPSGTAPGTVVFDTNGPADVTQAGGLSPYGTMAQNGNRWEWEESLNSYNWMSYDLSSFEEYFYGRYYKGFGIRGGDHNRFDIHNFSSSSRSFARPNGQSDFAANIGFRVVRLPEPGTLALALLGIAFGLWRAWSRRAA